MQIDNIALEVSVFSVATRTNSKQFVSVKVSSLQLHHSSFKVINILDQTVSIQFDKSKGEKKILQLINACFSHQLRNPINALLVANLKFRTDSQQLRHLMTTFGVDSIQGDQIMRVVDAMIANADSQDSQTQLLHFYVSDLLCMAEIEKKNFKKHITRFNIRKAIDAVIRIQREFSEPKAVVVVTRFEGFFTDEISTDEFRLQQVVLKLLSNAIKFSRRRGKVSINSKLRNSDLRGKMRIDIEVIDEGIGISIEDQSKLFKLFGFLEQNGEDLGTQGLGMGLYVAKQIVDQFNGGMRVQSDIGRGSTFGFSIELDQGRIRRDRSLRMINPHYPKRVNRIRISNEGAQENQDVISCDLGDDSIENSEDHRLLLD